MPDPPCGGGGVNPTSRAQKDTHVALMILTSQRGGELLVEKPFSSRILCSYAFGANIRSYTKKGARHRTPFLQPPPRSFGGCPCRAPPPPPAEEFSGRRCKSRDTSRHASRLATLLSGSRPTLRIITTGSHWTTLVFGSIGLCYSNTGTFFYVCAVCRTHQTTAHVRLMAIMQH